MNLKKKFLIVVFLITVLLIISIVFQFAMGVFQVGFWAGILLTIVVIGFVAFKINGRNGTPKNNKEYKDRF